MDSYNLVNGVHSTQNQFLNLKVLKGEWGFQGILMSDWDATYDGVAAVNNGLDLEMPSPKFMNAKNLIPAVESGKVKESTIDEHLLRLFRTELRYGFTIARNSILPTPPTRSPIAPSSFEERLKASRCSRMRATAASRSRQGQDHRHHRPRRLPGGHRRRRLVRGPCLRASQHSHRHRQPPRSRRACLL